MSWLFATLLAYSVPSTRIPVEVSSHHATVPATVTRCPLVITSVADAGIATIRGATVRTFVPTTQFVMR